MQELYQVHPTSEEAFAFDGEQLDLRPMVRELVLMELPGRAAVPGRLRRHLPDAAAPTATWRPATARPTPVDPRWAGLDALRASLEAER